MLAFLSINKWCGASLLALGAVVALPAPPARGAAPIHLRTAEATVRGQVTDENGSGLPGVTVVVNEVTGLGTSTDADGNFTLNVPTGNETLVVSSIGYVAQEIALGGRTTLDFDMSAAPNKRRGTQAEAAPYSFSKAK